MEVIVIAYTSRGGILSKRLKEKFIQSNTSCSVYLFYKYHVDGVEPFTDADLVIKDAFQQGKAIVFICAAGIAVRKIAPYIRRKDIDSAVVVVDEKGTFSISLLSGHIGGANELAYRCAEYIGAQPVITTATDLHSKFAVDVFAVKNGLKITKLERIKEISSAVLKEDFVDIAYDERWIHMKERPPQLQFIDIESLKEDRLSIVISPYDTYAKMQNVMHLIPPQILIGIGCKKNTPYEVLHRRLQSVLEQNRIDVRAIRAICSIDVKKDEEAIVTMSKKLKVPFYTFSKEELQRVQGQYSESDFVKKSVGVGNVCERSVIAGAKNSSELIVKKDAEQGVTIAVAIETYELKATVG